MRAGVGIWVFGWGIIRLVEGAMATDFANLHVWEGTLTLFLGSIWL